MDKTLAEGEFGNHGVGVPLPHMHEAGPWSLEPDGFLPSTSPLTKEGVHCRGGDIGGGLGAEFLHDFASREKTARVILDSKENSCGTVDSMCLP